MEIPKDHPGAQIVIEHPAYRSYENVNSLWRVTLKGDFIYPNYGAPYRPELAVGLGETLEAAYAMACKEYARRNRAREMAGVQDFRPN